MLHLAGTVVPETKVQNDGKVKLAPAKTRALVKVRVCLGREDFWFWLAFVYIYQLVSNRRLVRLKRFVS
jgi:hypothetical protein